jgi:CheY-like chemotaxis protein
MYALSLIPTSLARRYLAGMGGRKVLLVDDHAVFRRAAADFLSSGGCQVVAVAGSGEEALEMLAGGGERPDVVLLDCRLPGLDGVEVAQLIASLPDPPPVILISSWAEAAVDPRLDAGAARGFLLKQDLTCQAIAALLG